MERAFVPDGQINTFDYLIRLINQTHFMVFLQYIRIASNEQRARAMTVTIPQMTSLKKALWTCQQCHQRTEM